jgi:hypothetical protein
MGEIHLSSTVNIMGRLLSLDPGANESPQRVLQLWVFKGIKRVK